MGTNRLEEGKRKDPKASEAWREPVRRGLPSAFLSLRHFGSCQGSDGSEGGRAWGIWGQRFCFPGREELGLDHALVRTDSLSQKGGVASSTPGVQVQGRLAILLRAHAFEL